jgi:hypothetical protein
MADISKNMLDYLDKAAYNCPDVFPPVIRRADYAPHRVYFRFMRVIYALYKSGTVSTDELRRLKKDFINDLKLYSVYFNASMKGTRENILLSSALAECRKNSEYCPKCNAVSHIIGEETRENSMIPDLNYGGDENGDK